MRLPTLFFSVLVHGGAIGALVAVGAYANDEVRRAPRVEIQSSVASTPSAEQVPTEADIAPLVVLEASPLPAELPQDPIVPERALYHDVIEDQVVAEFDSVVWPEFRVSLAWVQPISKIEPALAEPVEVVVPPPVTPTPVAPTPVAPTPVAPTPVAPTPVSVHTAASPRADNQVPPYPQHELALGREGTVLVTATVDRHGLVVAATLAKASRYAGFNRAALAAVRKWRFTPGMVDGAPIEDEVDVPVIFQLRDRKR